MRHGEGISKTSGTIALFHEMKCAVVARLSEGRSPEFRSHRHMSPWNSNRGRFCDAFAWRIIYIQLNSNLDWQGLLWYNIKNAFHQCQFHNVTSHNHNYVQYFHRKGITDMSNQNKKSNIKDKKVIIDLFVLWLALTALSCAAINLHISLNKLGKKEE